MKNKHVPHLAISGARRDTQVWQLNVAKEREGVRDEAAQLAGDEKAAKALYWQTVPLPEEIIPYRIAWILEQIPSYLHRSSTMCARGAAHPFLHTMLCRARISSTQGSQCCGFILKLNKHLLTPCAPRGSRACRVSPVPRPPFACGLARGLRLEARVRALRSGRA